MWWERLIPKSYETSSVICGVECLFLETGNVFHFSLLQLKKNTVSILETGSSNDLEPIIKKAKKQNAPLVFTITGKGIITKSITASEQEPIVIEKLIAQHLPTIQSDDFYVQYYPCQNSSGFLTLCRKELMDAFIAQFKKEKIECVTIHIGLLVCNALASVTTSYNRLYSAKYELQLSQGYVKSVQQINDSEQIALKIGSLSIESKGLISFASGFGYLTQQTINTSNSDTIQLLHTQHQERLRLKYVGVTLIVIVFLLSVLNSVLFFQKYEEENALTVQLNLYESKHAQITELLANYQKKKLLIEQAGIFNNQKQSLYAHKIAETLPPEIVLTALSVNPKVEQTEQDSLVTFLTNKITIQGNCTKSLLLNEWITVLKNQSFVKSVNLERFTFNTNGYLPNFTLNLEIK